MRKFDIDENRRNKKNGENYDRDKRQRQILPPKATLQATTPVPVMHGDAWLWWVTLLENAIFFYGTRLLVNHSDVLTWIDQQSENMTWDRIHGPCQLFFKGIHVDDGEMRILLLLLLSNPILQVL